VTLVLASASPRRKEILATLGLTFEVRPSDADEARDGDEPPKEYAKRVAIAKATAVARGCRPGEWVLGADTIVVIDGEVLGKPESDAAARGMLKMLGGRWHEVTTAVALCEAGGALLGAIVVTSRVKMRPIELRTLERYVATGEGRDKAGGYAVQGIGSGLVSAIEGSYSSVVGLPAAETLQLLERHGVIAEWP
jgi:septum formation protein